MDFACSIQRSNVLITGGGTSCRIPDRLINSRFRCQGFGCKFFNPRIVSKSGSTRNIRESIAGGCLDPSLVSIDKFKTNLWVSYSNKSLFRSVDGVFKVPRGVISQCQDNDSLACVNGNGRNVEFDSDDESSRVEFADGVDSNGLGGDDIEVKEDAEAPSLDELKELLVKAMKELEVAQVNSIMSEEKAQRISENAIALKDEASNVWKDVTATLDMIQEIVNECIAKETVQKATMALSLAEAKLQVAIESLQVAKEEDDSSEGFRVNDTEGGDREEDGVLLAAETEIRECQANLANCEAQLKQLQSKKEELQKEVDRLNEVAEKAKMNALKAEEKVANIMLLAKQAVAFELEVVQRVNNAEIALQRAEKSVSISRVDISGRNKGCVSGDEATVEEEKVVKTDDANTEREKAANVIDGKAVAKQIRDEITAEVSRMKDAIGIVPGLAVILVGDRKDSATYVRNKKKACESVGIKSFEVRLPEDSSEQEVLNYIAGFNEDPLVHGILVQLPLPSHMNEQSVLNAVTIEKDVDGFHPLNIGRLAMRGREPLFVPCTPKGCIELLHRYGIDIKGKRAVVIGRSNIVGMPAALLLQREDATISIVHSRTPNPEDITRQADIIISAVGQPNMVRENWIKPGAVIIDVGINPVEDAKSPRGYRLVGDVCYEEACKVASAVTPVPGGVGPMTIAMLLSNTLSSAKRLHNFK